MQEPIRYYITKRGEEPTVRSVKVAQRAVDGEEHQAPKAEEVAEAVPEAPTKASARAVERLVKSAMRGRSSQR